MCLSWCGFFSTFKRYGGTLDLLNTSPEDLNQICEQWCKNTSKYYLSRFFRYLYFTIYIFDNFYFFYFCFTTFLNKMYFLLHMFSLTPKSTRYILNAQQDRKMVQFTHLSRKHPWSSLLLLIWRTHLTQMLSL